MRSKIFNSIMHFRSVLRKLNIGMIDADLLDNGTRHPNLAQMKMSAYCKERGHNVRLLYDDAELKKLECFDAIIVSKVFTFSKLPEEIQVHMPAEKNLEEANLCVKEKIESLEKSSRKSTVFLIGGTGFFSNGGRNLHDEIEHIMPDYSLYVEFIDHMESLGRRRESYDDYENYSIGFTTRGCFRKCDFCVNKKYDRAFKHSPIKEFLDETRSGIYLWDDNFFSFFDGWEEILDEIISTNKPFQFRQGLDIRLLTEKHAEMLSRGKYGGDYIFAFDHIEDKEIIIKKLKLWRNYCNKTTKLYLLCAFDPQNRWDGFSDIRALEIEDVKNTLERIKILMYFGCLPYVMRYESYKESFFKNMYVQLARWCNQPRFFKKMSFREFCKANQQYHKNKGTYCSAYKAMLDFESDYPDIAADYFDLRFDEINMYETNLSYARDGAIACPACNDRNFVSWDSVASKCVSDDNVLLSYFTGDLDFHCLRRHNAACKVDGIEIAKKITVLLSNETPSSILKILEKSEPRALEISTIPQFSNLRNATHVIPQLLKDGKKLTFSEIGALLPGRTSDKPAAIMKYGENHSKLAAIMDLVFIDDVNGVKYVTISPMGANFMRLDEEARKNLINLLLLRIPIIQTLIREAEATQSVKIIEVLMKKTSITKSTGGRRASSINMLIGKLSKTSDLDFYMKLKRIS